MKILETVRDEPGGERLNPLRALDKGELHVHFNGALPLAAIKKVLADEATNIPPGFDLERDLVRQVPCRSLAEYLVPWQLLSRFPNSLANLQKLADAVLASLAEHSVRFVELRSSVLYLAMLQGCSVTQSLERLIIATGTAALRHGIRRGLVLTVTRGDHGVVSLSALLQAYNDLGRPGDVVGIDLAGDEETPYPAELPGLFLEAKARYGLGVTIHAGETGRSDNIRSAVELFGAERVGHGTAAGMDPPLMELLRERDICIEVCPISNRLTRAVPLGDAHPIREFEKAGVPYVICSDNPGIHQRGLTDDFSAAMEEGVSLEDLQRQYARARRYTFIKDLE